MAKKALKPGGKKTTASKNKGLSGVKGKKKRNTKKNLGSVNTTKTLLIDKVAKQTGLTQKDAQAVINSYNENIKKSVDEGFDVTIREFGTFKGRTTPVRLMKTGWAGKKLITPKKVGGRKTIKFYASKSI